MHLEPNTLKVLKIDWAAWRVCCDYPVSPHNVSDDLVPFRLYSPLPSVVADSLAIGLLGDDDNGATDLGTLEKKLAEKQQSRQASQAVSNPTSPSQATSAQEGAESTPRSSLTSPEPAKDRDSEKRKSLTPDGGREGEEEVEALSEMMCSLVTNNSGETRYIGMLRSGYPGFVCLLI